MNPTYDTELLFNPLESFEPRNSLIAALTSHALVSQGRRLLPFSFQFFTRLTAVFAEEVGGFGIFARICYI